MKTTMVPKLCCFRGEQVNPEGKLDKNVGNSKFVHLNSVTKSLLLLHLGQREETGGGWQNHPMNWKSAAFCWIPPFPGRLLPKHWSRNMFLSNYCLTRIATNNKSYYLITVGSLVLGARVRPKFWAVGREGPEDQEGLEQPGGSPSCCWDGRCQS